MKTIAATVLLLVLSNTIMTYAWYGHLKNMNHSFWLLAVIASWGLAFFEYLFQVPANRLGFHLLTLPQLKILQEAIALMVFVPFAVLYMKQSLSWNYLWATLCILGAVFFIFRG